MKTINKLNISFDEDGRPKLESVERKINELIDVVNCITLEKIRELEGKQFSYLVEEKRETKPCIFCDNSFPNPHLDYSCVHRKEEWVKCICGSQTKPRGGTVELAGIIHSEEDPCKEEPKPEWKPCTCPKGSVDCDKCDGVEYVKEEPKPVISIDTIRKAAEESNKMQREYAGLEPKSTLREDIKEILCEAMFLKTEYLDPTGNKDADKIISLFKDTLLKEMTKVHSNWSFEGNNPVEREDIINLIKNL